MTQIDAHHHFWEYDSQKHAWIDDGMSVLKQDFMPQDLKEELNKVGVDGSVAVQADQSEQETDFLLNLAEKNSFIKGVVGWIDLKADTVDKRLQYYSQYEKLKGFRHIVQDEPDDKFLLRPDFIRGINKLKKFDFCYDILIYSRHLPVTIKFTEKFPDQKFVLDHIAKPSIKEQKIKDWEENIRILASHPKMYCKLSGIITEAAWDTWSKDQIWPYLDVVTDAFGANRLMFGSDWPVCKLAGSYTEVYELIEDYIKSFSEDDKTAIMGKNAISFYGL